MKSIFNKKEAWKGVKLAGKRISLAKAFSTAELIDKLKMNVEKEPVTLMEILLTTKNLIHLITKILIINQ